MKELTKKEIKEHIKKCPKWARYIFKLKPKRGVKFDHSKRLEKQKRRNKIIEEYGVFRFKN